VRAETGPELLTITPDGATHSAYPFILLEFLFHLEVVVNDVFSSLFGYVCFVNDMHGLSLRNKFAVLDVVSGSPFGLVLTTDGRCMRQRPTIGIEVHDVGTGYCAHGLGLDSGSFPLYLGITQEFSARDVVDVVRCA
jgi:hypothetical protein